MRKTSVFIAFLFVVLAGFGVEAKRRRVPFFDPQYVKQSFDWQFSCDFPEDFKNSARFGFDYWNMLAGRVVFTEQPCGEDILRNVVVYYSDKSREGSDEMHFTIAQTSFSFVGAIRTVTFFREWTAPENFMDTISVARHEVGHVLGFEHSDDKKCLMYPTIVEKRKSWNAVACEEERRIFRRYYGRP